MAMLSLILGTWESENENVVGLQRYEQNYIPVRNQMDVTEDLPHK